MYNTHTPPRVSYTRHTSHNNTHKARPNYHYGGKPHTHTPPPYINTNITTAKDIRHEGVNISQLKFKKRIEQFTDRPSDRVGSTHTFTHPQSPMSKRLPPPHGTESNGKRVEKSDGFIPEPIHPFGSPHPLPRGGEKLTKGHTKNNTMRVPHKRPKLGRPGKRATAVKTEEEQELPGPTVIDARRHKKERLAPVHFLKCSRNPAHIKRKLSWWDLAIDTHASKTRLSRRWTYILNRRQRRQPVEPQQP